LGSIAASQPPVCVRAKPKNSFFLKKEKKKKKEKRVRHANKAARFFSLILLQIQEKKRDEGNKCLILREEIFSSFQA
jgi:hypothetical protein